MSMFGKTHNFAKSSPLGKIFTVYARFLHKNEPYSVE